VDENAAERLDFDYVTMPPNFELIGKDKGIYG
jgi:hypothetical protein